MPRTPDRFPGVREDEGVIISDESVDPAVVGEVRYNAGAFRLRDALGVFNPRSTFTPTAVGQILYSVDGLSFVPAHPVVDDEYVIIIDDEFNIVVEI